MATVRWGILSTADIGLNQVIPAIQRAQSCEVVAIASRDEGRAVSAADRLEIRDAYGGYEDLLSADNVDAVYVPLPNDMHAEWVIKAASAGKHVLCEKPLAMSGAQAEEMVRACRKAGVNLQEAFMYRHHPQWVETVRLVRQGSIGDLVGVQSWFSFYNDDPTDIRNRLDRGGGAVMDIGCYSISVARMLFDAEPVQIESVTHRDAAMGIDIVSSGILTFPGGGQSTFTCSTRAGDAQWVHIVGTTGRIMIEVPFNPRPDRKTRIVVTVNDDSLEADVNETIVFPAVDQYSVQAAL
ncbi:MAG: Gfo/Idh/MocA family protein, partial [Acidimicrobiia bacterium]